MSQILTAIKQHAELRPYEIALRSGQISAQIREITYQQLATLITDIAAEFQHKKIRRVGLCLDNSIEWVLSDLAAIQAGIIIITIPLFFTPQQLVHLIKDAGLDALIVDKEWLEVSPLATTLTNNEDVKPFSSNDLESIDVSIIRLENNETSENNSHLKDTFKITYTSGSTGDPKGVCLSLKTIENVALALQTAVKPLAIKKHLCIMPLATLLENIAGVYVPLLEGCMVQVEHLEEIGLHLSSGLNTTQFLGALNTIRPHSLIALPQFLKLLVNVKQQIDTNVLSQFNYLRFIAVGGGKTPIQTLQQAIDLNLPVYEGYGLSECASVVSLNTPKFNRLGSVGKPLLPDTIIIEKNNEIIVNEQVMQGYLSSSATTTPLSQTINTGDLGYFDSEGYLYLNGRKKNLIISSFGRNISPEWVESELEASALISQVVAYGEGKPFLTAVITAQLEINNSEIEAIIQNCNDRLPDYAQIRRWIRANEAFSLRNGLLTYNGRPKRLAIYDRYSEALERVYLANCSSKNSELSVLK